MMTPRHFLLSTLLLALAAPGALAQDSIDQLAELIKASSTSADPGMAFMTGFERMDDFKVGPDELRMHDADRQVLLLVERDDGNRDRQLVPGVGRPV